MHDYYTSMKHYIFIQEEMERDLDRKCEHLRLTVPILKGV